MKDTGYECKECGKPVEVIGEVVIRVCPHKDAAVVAVMTAVATGEGRTEQA